MKVNEERIKFLESQIIKMWHGEVFQTPWDALGLTHEEYKEWTKGVGSSNSLKAKLTSGCF